MDIWQVIQFSAAASVVAAVILGLKLLFHDKLDARWHYLIWLVLLVRMLVPVQLDKIRTPVSLFGSIPVLRWLGMGERAVHRAGFDGTAHALFLGYLAGTAAFLLYDLTGYLLLRLRIASAKEGVPGDSGRSSIFRASEGVCRRVEETAQKYGLKACSQICVQDTPTPYVCGLWKTALVLTREMACRLEAQDRAAGAFDPDEAVIVHELLHRKYKDVPVNFLIRLVRALNWFNPFLWYVTGVVQNDGEALCDQRVLEYLEQKREGENGYEREYGLLLIRMAEGRERNPAKAGTSNMANSFRNMKTRIRRIADFKKVPPGIGPVTLCITVMLSASSIGYCREESYFPAQSGQQYAFTGFTVYNLQAETEEQSCAEVLAYTSGEENPDVLWEIGLVRENGWKVWEKGETQADAERFEESALLQASGQGENRISGSELMKGQRICIGKGGGDPARWEGTERPSFHVWVYVDGECAEEFTVTVP